MDIARDHLPESGQQATGDATIPTHTVEEFDIGSDPWGSQDVPEWLRAAIDVVRTAIDGGASGGRLLTICRRFGTGLQPGRFATSLLSHRPLLRQALLGWGR